MGNLSPADRRIDCGHALYSDVNDVCAAVPPTRTMTTITTALRHHDLFTLYILVLIDSIRIGKLI